ncbi:MAG TPA: class I SAM-dependent methyltransferase [archaeon]|nr:class I SAM-dependent methyltransferase [archaeon]
MSDNNLAIRLPEPRTLGLDELYLEQSHCNDTDIYLDGAVKLMLSSTNGPILDVGCNSGRFAHYLSTLTRRHVYGVDIDKNAVSMANEMYGGTENLHFEVCNVYDLGKKFRGFGLVSCLMSLHHFDDLAGALVQMTGVLNTRGIVAIHDWDRYLGLPQLERCGLEKADIDDVQRAHKRSSERSVRKLLRKKGILYNPSILTLFSVMAAYTEKEVAENLKDLGFYTETTSAPDDAKFYLAAYRRWPSRMLHKFSELTGLNV